MRVLVTGGAGFLGRHVANRLLHAGYHVIIFDRARVNGFDMLQGDLLDAEVVNTAVQMVDAVCHLGAIGDVYLAFEQPALAAAVNVVGTANIMGAAKANGTQKVVYASTWEVYGKPEYSPIDENHPTRPEHPYNITKLAGEDLVLSYDRLKDVPALALRIGTAYGTGMRPNSVFSLFVAKAERGEPIVIHGSGAQTRQFTHASDIGEAFARALESDARGEAFNVVADDAHSIRQLAEAVVRILPTETHFGEPRFGDVPPAAVSNQKARDILHWQPEMPFEQGLQELIAWQLARMPEKSISAAVPGFK